MAFPTIIVVNGTLKKIDGTPEKGHIVFQASVNVLSSTDATVVVPSYKVVELDEDGSFSVPLPASNDPSWNPNNWTYRVIEQLTAGKKEFRTIVPYDASGGQFDYADMLPAIDVDAQLYAAYNHVHPGGGGDAVTWDDVTGKPTTFPPSTHNHDDRYYTEAETLALFAAVDYPVDSVAGKTGVVTLVKADVGLSNVDNTSDTSKPISSATQTALNGKEATGVAAVLVGNHNSDTTDVHGIADTSALVTSSDLSSAISAIDFPVDSVAGKTGTVTLVKADVGLSSVDNTADSAKSFTMSQISDIGAKVIVLDIGDDVPGGTPAGTVIVRV